MSETPTKKFEHDFNVYIATYRRDEDPRQVNVDIERRPDGFILKHKTKKGQDMLLGTITVPGTSTKIKLVAFINRKKGLEELAQEEKTEEQENLLES